jgi:hypothetical protein
MRNLVKFYIPVIIIIIGVIIVFMRFEGSNKTDTGGNPPPAPTVALTEPPATPTETPNLTFGSKPASAQGCGTVPLRMDAPFFTDNAVTYTAVIGEDEIPTATVLTSDGTPGSAFCIIAVNSFLPGFGPMAGIFTGPISSDGTTCNLAGTAFHLNSPIVLDLQVVSGNSTLIEDGHVFRGSNVVVVNPQGQPTTLTIPGVDAICENVQSLASVGGQEAKTKAVQQIHDEALEDLQNELGEKVSPP